ncbi:phosphate acyltransferase PlsX [Ligilactobacillus saerimneri]|uniref:Phosphate acyltransferase n=1 Tax=Ligilactobacillus saerimneri 30a TaxID=1227363 RepID=M5J5U6_9LACO|nr:Fatty acid/phospholipid synthesis protein [Ligilactobacillus saerimneri 30a]
MKIAVDAMGGDYAPQSVVAGVERARDEFKDVEFLLFGNQAQLTELIKDKERLTIIPTTELITMNDEPVKAIRKKKDSSLVRAAQAVKDGAADALFSCGNTGALLAAGLFIIGRIRGVARPGLLSTLPIISGQEGVFNLLDSGANADGKPEHLYQYALLGKYYAESVRGIDNPRIGLLNNGTEPHKGSKLTVAAHQLISADPSLNFVGNVEARDMANGSCDVIVADGFTGNAALKSMEGTAKGIMTMLKDAIMTSGVKGKLGALLLKPSLMKLKQRMDQSTYGGAVLLGAKAPVVKAHGASDARTVYYTVKQIRAMVAGQMIPKFTAYLATQQSREDS